MNERSIERVDRDDTPHGSGETDWEYLDLMTEGQIEEGFRQDAREGVWTEGDDRRAEGTGVMLYPDGSKRRVVLIDSELADRYGSGERIERALRAYEREHPNAVG